MWLLNILVWAFWITVFVCVAVFTISFVVVDLLITAAFVAIFAVGGIIAWVCMFLCGLIFGKKG
jgi:hypothetical protein